LAERGEVLKFSLFHLAAGPEGTSEADEFRKILEQCEAADRLGFDIVWFAEHHFSRVGREIVSEGR
jgi:alkanesulfonate monooxygenase SsuD/methylene tetrahydromethanopterin reductase-like flavin-dependent oxidoreductase (luciferase family)